MRYMFLFEKFNRQIRDSNIGGKNCSLGHDKQHLVLKIKGKAENFFNDEICLLFPLFLILWRKGTS
jgi:hypothetical protein